MVRHAHRHDRSPLLTGVAAAVLATLLGCASTAPPALTRVRVASRPSGALVTVVPTDPSEHWRTMVGITPVDAELALPAAGTGRLLVELRGYRPVELDPGAATTPITVDLEPSGDPTAPDPTLTGAAAVVLVGPDVELIRRGFAHEETSAAGSERLADALAAAVADTLGAAIEVRRLAAGDVPPALLRDAGSAAALLDPVRLPFSSRLPQLETAAGRRGAQSAGSAGGARPLLILSGRSSIETGGMKAGKIGLMVAGTAASYGAAYGQAVANGHDSFVYTVYLPAGTGGARLDAILVDAANGDVLWLNRGVYASLDPAHPERLAAVAADLLAGIPVQGPGATPVDARSEPDTTMGGE